MSARDKAQVLLGRLVKATGEGRVEWKKTEDHPYSYEFEGTEGDAVIIDSRDDDGRAPYDLLVYAPDGELAAEIKWSTHEVEVGNAQDAQLEKLWELARDHAAGSAQVIDRLLRQVPDPGDIPF